MIELEILIPIALFAMIGYITRVISDNRLIRKLADSPHMSSDAAARLMASRERQPGSLTSLKWGLVVLALGLSVLFVSLVGIDFESPVAYGFILFAAGVGLITYYFIAREEDESSDESISDSTHPVPASSRATDTTESAESSGNASTEPVSEDAFDPTEAFEDAGQSRSNEG